MSNHDNDKKFEKVSFVNALSFQELAPPIAIRNDFISNKPIDAACFSDRRLKKDIAYLATLENGIRLYSFRYTWSNDFTYVGVMAQDLLLSPFHRDAVTLEQNSFYSVDYHILGLRMITLSEWQHSHDNILIQSAERAGEIEAA